MVSRRCVVSRRVWLVGGCVSRRGVVSRRCVFGRRCG